MQADSNLPKGKQKVGGAVKALPKKNLSDSGQPGGGQGRVDITGTMPADIKVDPYITEGHPGYEESGNSEIIPQEAEEGT